MITEERQFPIGSLMDAVLPSGVHRYWSTHCRHGNHDLCKGTCKGCTAMCICGCGCGRNPEPVGGSTPTSPAQCEHNIAVAGAWLQCQNTPDHDGLHISGRRRWRTGGTLEPAGEVVSVPLPAIDDEPGRHDPSRCSAWTTVPEGKCTCPREPAPVPPPVDALLKLVDEFGREAHAYGLGDDSFGDTMTDSWKEINSRVRALWAAGVEEGRQQLDEVQKLAALHGYELGVAEGRRQATEERTEGGPA